MGDLKAIGMRFYEDVFNKGDLTVIDELLADDFVDHEETPGFAGDKEGVKGWMAALREGFPDLAVEVQAMVAEGDEIWVQATMRGTHEGAFMEVPATGKSVEVNLFDRVRFEGDKVVEHWGLTDEMSMMSQLGLVPEM